MKENIHTTDVACLDGKWRMGVWTLEAKHLGRKCLYDLVVSDDSTLLYTTVGTLTASLQRAKKLLILESYDTTTRFMGANLQLATVHVHRVVVLGAWLPAPISEHSVSSSGVTWRIRNTVSKRLGSNDFRISSKRVCTGFTGMNSVQV